MSPKESKIDEKTEKVAFVISPIGDEKTPTRKRSDQILKYIIEPIAIELGFKPIRADKITKPGIITTQIIEHILNDPLVIADLTDHNPNVMYELALRHAIKKPTVQLIAENQLLPFDVSGNRTIKLDHTDLDSVNIAKDELKKQIQEVMKNPDLVDSPISQAITLSGLKQSDNPISSTLSSLSSAISDVVTRLAKIEQKMFAEEKVSSSPFITLESLKGTTSFEPVKFDKIFGTIDWSKLGEEHKKAVEKEKKSKNSA